MRQYETVFIIDPGVDEAGIEREISSFKETVTAGKGDLVGIHKWGRKKLAYPIQKKSTGFYYMIEFRADGGLIQKIETEFKRDERIIRFLVVELEKYAVAYAERKRARKKAEKEKIKEE